jgi:hypothetical protein
MGVSVDDGGDGLPEVVDGAGGSLAKHGFHLGEGVLDRVEVWGLRRQEQELCACRFDGFAGGRSFMSGQVVQDHDIAGAERRD